MDLIVSYVNRLHIARQDYSIYVQTTSTMSSEKHLDGDSGELSEFDLERILESVLNFTPGEKGS